MAAVGWAGCSTTRIVLAASLVWLFAARVQTQKPPEYQVKAAYLYGFGRFIEWPSSAPATAGNSFVVCVIGDDPFGHWLDDVAVGAVMKEKPVTIRRITQLDDSKSCHTLFISGAEEARLAKIVEFLARQPVLTVSDTPQFAQRGGMIGFSVDGNRVRFTVNLSAAQAAGLVMNSELLRVAATVLKDRQPGP